MGDREIEIQASQLKIRQFHINYHLQQNTLVSHLFSYNPPYRAQAHVNVNKDILVCTNPNIKTKNVQISNMEIYIVQLLKTTHHNI